MGTCPKCKLRIRRNGNHIKLGTLWLHKICPAKPARAAEPATATKRSSAAKPARAAKRS